jgi:hypothetical protein
LEDERQVLTRERVFPALVPARVRDLDATLLVGVAAGGPLLQKGDGKA